MTVTRADVDRIAGLARLRLDDGEADRLTGEMNRILEYADRLRATGPGGDVGAGAGESGDAFGDGASAAQAEDVGGARDGRTEGPDLLAHPPSDFAPRFEEGFFVVPPPQGVQADP